MSKECALSCPTIPLIKEGFREDAHPDVALSEILELWCKSDNCKGPREYEVEVVVGFFRRRKETRFVIVCGLDEQFKPVAPGA